MHLVKAVGLNMVCSGVTDQVVSGMRAKDGLSSI